MYGTDAMLECLYGMDARNRDQQATRSVYGDSYLGRYCRSIGLRMGTTTRCISLPPGRVCWLIRLILCDAELGAARDGRPDGGDPPDDAPDHADAPAHAHTHTLERR
jgi:hypothetical protein